ETDIAEAVAYIPGAVFARDLGLQIGMPNGAHGPVRHLAHCQRNAAVYIEYLAGGIGRFQRQPAGAGDVIDTYEIALLHPVFKDEWPVSVQYSGSKVT